MNPTWLFSHLLKKEKPDFLHYIIFSYLSYLYTDKCLARKCINEYDPDRQDNGSNIGPYNILLGGNNTVTEPTVDTSSLIVRQPDDTVMNAIVPQETIAVDNDVSKITTPKVILSP